MPYVMPHIKIFFAKTTLSTLSQDSRVKTHGCLQAAFKHQVLMATGPCIKLQLPLCSLINRVQRLFFLNEAQNLSSFLIADLGVAKYPSYAVTRSRSVFSCRQDLLEYECALEHAAELDNALEVRQG